MSFKDSKIVPVIAVDDLDRAVSFYRDTLGLETRADQDPSAAYVKAGGDSWFLLYKSGYKRGETTVASFIVPDVERTVDELRGRGLKFEEYDFPGLKTERGIATQDGMKTAWFKDTEGNTIAVSEVDAERMRRAA